MSALIDGRLPAKDAAPSAAKRLAPVASAESYWCAFWSLLLLSCLPFLIPYMRTLWHQELYQYFPFLMLAVGGLFYRRWDQICRGPTSWWSRAGCGVGIALLGLAAVMHSTWLGAAGFVVLSFVFLASQKSLGGESLGYLAIPLLMLIRLPQLHSQSLVVRLQKWTTQLASLQLDVLRVPHDAHAHSIHLPHKDLFVAEACSGIQSAFTMCCLALLLVVWRRRPPAAILFYTAAALVLAVLTNTLRVTTIALAEVWFAWDLTEGWVHDAVGYFSLAIGVAILLSFDRLATLMLHPVEIAESRRGANPIGVAWNYVLGFQPQDYASDQVYGSEPEIQALPMPEFPSGRRARGGADGSAPRWRTPRWSLAMAGTAAISALVMMGGLALGRSDQRPIISKEAVLFNPPERFLEGRIGVLAVGDHEVIRNGTDPQLGLHADVWNCGTRLDRGVLHGQVVMSQPYVGWHELCVCYEVQGWHLERRYNLPIAEGTPVAVGEFTKGTLGHGYLIFAAIDTDGTTPTPPSYTLFGRLLAPFGPLVTDDFAETSGSAQTVMLQFWTISKIPLSSQEIVELAESFSGIRSRARDGIVAAGERFRRSPPAYL